jgi:alcohol dehydrogenase
VFTEPTAAACRILEQIAIDHSTRIAVVGDGRMGLIVAQVLRTATPDVTVFGRHEKKLDVARSLGMTAAMTDVSIEGADRFDVVVDVTGRPEGMRRALEIVRPRGTVVMKSTFHGQVALATWPIVVEEITMVGSRCGPFRPALELLASGAVKVHPLISRIAPLQDYEPAFAEARRAIKVLFHMP